MCELNHGIKKSFRLSVLRSDEGPFPRDGFDVQRHAAPAADEHFAIVKVTSEDPSGSPPLVRVGLQTVDSEYEQGRFETGRAIAGQGITTYWHTHK
jgi:hypothetical protein